MAKKNDKAELPKNVPIIKVRQQFVTKCGTTCAGQGHEREKRWPPCGPSPPASLGSNITCGMPDCYEEDTCRCRCPCALKEMMRMAAEPPSQETPTQSVQTVPQLHVARIYTLEPKSPTVHLRRWPREHVWRETRRAIPCRPPRYAHAVLENMLPHPRPPCGVARVKLVRPNGVRDFWW